MVSGSWSDFPRNGPIFEVFGLQVTVTSELTSITKIFVLKAVSGFKHGLLHVVSVGFYCPKPKLGIG
jgi:hypothetical protein